MGQHWGDVGSGLVLGESLREKRQWSRKGERYINEGEWNRQTCTFSPPQRYTKFDYTLNTYRLCESKTNIPVKLPSASAAKTMSKCTNAPSVKTSAQTVDQCFSMLTCDTQECSPVWTNRPEHNLQAEHSQDAGSLCLQSYIPIAALQGPRACWWDVTANQSAASNGV